MLFSRLCVNASVEVHGNSNSNCVRLNLLPMSGDACSVLLSLPEARFML
jgi:hypothetical protein